MSLQVDCFKNKSVMSKKTLVKGATDRLFEKVLTKNGHTVPSKPSTVITRKL